MATTNYKLPTITGNMAADVVRDMNALAEATDGAIKKAVDGVDLSTVTQQIGAVDQRVTTHLAETTYKLTRVSRDASISGVQSVVLGFRPKMLQITATIEGTKKMAVLYTDVGSVRGYFIKGATGTIINSGVQFLNLTDDNLGNASRGYIAVTDSGFTITWDVSGTVSGLIVVDILAFAHGGVI